MPGGKRLWSQLNSRERFSFFIGHALNETHLGKRASTAYMNAVTRRWLRYMTSQINHVDGAEHLPRDRSFIIAANHRTYFDFYATIVGIWHLFDPKPFLYCPVRSKFFYDKRRGALFNMLISGNCMYPPVFRGDRGPGMNQYMVDACVRLLDWSPRTIIAIHPEGRRNEGDDPYAFLPAKRGIGRIALAAKAPVIPLFINGLKTRFGSQLRGRKDIDHSEIRIFFGAPTDMTDLYDASENPEAQQEAADRVMADIRACSERERAYLSQ